MTGPLLALIAKLLSGASARWIDCQPDTCQRVYFANHTSHLDSLVIWSSLPGPIRSLTRPVAAKDYWGKSKVRRYLAREFNALLIDRKVIKVHQSPVDLMLREIGDTQSLIVFPEGHRSVGEQIGEFKSGLYYLCKKRPDLEAVPVHLDNMNRILPRGEFLPVPLLSCITFGPPIWLETGEPKVDFLKRAREALLRLKRYLSMVDDPATWIFVAGVLLLLGAATTVGQFLKGQPESGLNPAMIQTFNRRVRVWWLLCSLLAAALFFPRSVTVVLFGLLSFWALREFITLTPTRLSDHRTLFWVFILFTPLQFVLVGWGKYDWYSILIPVFGLLFVTARVAFSGDPKRFLERTAKIQAGLVLCIYCLSLAPALLFLDIYTTPDLTEYVAIVKDKGPKSAEAMAVPMYGKNALLLFYFVFMVQMGDALQYVWGKILGKRVIAPAISPTRTWEGLVGGAGSTALLGAALFWATPFNEWQAGCLSLVIALAGFAGGMAMSAIKRDRGVKDYGTLVVGHGGVLDRIDSLCFAAPVFFLLTKTFFTFGSQ